MSKLATNLTDSNTSNHPAALPAGEPSLAYGHLCAVKEGRLRLHTPSGKLWANRAAGCLLDPEPGDLVLVSTDRTGRAFVISVLERNDRHAAELSFTGDLRLSAPGGNLEIRTGQSLSITADQLEVTAREGGITLEKASFLGQLALVRLKALDFAARTVDTVTRSFSRKTEDYTLEVEDHHEVQAGSSRTLVEDTLSMTAHDTHLISEDMTKIDADQVHIG